MAPTPALSDLGINADTRSLREQLGRRIGISENTTDPGPWALRSAFEANLGHAALLCRSPTRINSSTAKASRGLTKPLETPSRTFSVRAVPFSYYEMEAPANDPAHESPDKAMTAIDVGVITLNSTRNYAAHGESRWSKGNPRSLFTVMNHDEKSDVNDELARIALEVVSSPLAP